MKSELTLILSRSELIERVTSGDPAGVNALLSEFGHELSEYVHALVGDVPENHAILLEDILVDLLRRIRQAAELRNGDFRRFVFVSASKTVRRRHAWVFEAKATSRLVRAPMRDLARMTEPSGAKCREAVAGLGPDERELLALRYRFGFDFDDISEIRMEARVQFEERLTAAREQFRSRLLTASGIASTAGQSAANVMPTPEKARA